MMKTKPKEPSTSRKMNPVVSKDSKNSRKAGFELYPPHLRYWRLNAGPCACKAGALLLGPLHQPMVLAFNGMLK
jgi:hypothetical protein